MDKLLDILYNNKENIKEIDYIEAMNSISKIYREKQIYIMRPHNIILEIFGVFMISIICFALENKFFNTLFITPFLYYY
jgi:hypothetical protein